MSRRKSCGRGVVRDHQLLGRHLRPVQQFEACGPAVIKEHSLNLGIEMILHPQFAAGRNQGAGDGPGPPLGDGGRFPAQGQVNGGDGDHQAGHVVRKTAPGGQIAPQGQDAQFVALEEVTGDLLASHKLHGHIQAALGVVTQFFQGIGHTVGCGGRITVLMEGGPPLVLIFFRQVQIGFRILLGKAGDLVVGLLDIGLVEPTFAGLGIDHGKGGVGHVTGPVVEDDGFVGIGKGVFQAFVPEVEFLIGRVTIIPGEVGAKVPPETR